MNDHDSTALPRRRHPLRWLTTFLVVLALGVIAGGYLGSHSLNPLKWGIWSSSTDTQVVRSVKFDQKVTLMTLGMQGIHEAKADQKIFGKTVPGTTQTSYIQYEYDAALGIDGKNVDIKQTGDKSYTISIPQFEFLGHSNESFKPAIIDGGVLSFLAQDKDEATEITSILNADLEQKNIDDSREALERQAELFYTNIVHAIDPDITLTFTFDGAPATK